MSQLMKEQGAWNKSSFFAVDTNVKHTNITTIYNQNLFTKYIRNAKQRSLVFKIIDLLEWRGGAQMSGSKL